MKNLPALCLALTLLSSAHAQEAQNPPQPDAPPADFFANRPAFSPGDQPAQTVARCEEVRAQAEGVDFPGFRVDLSVAGRLTLVRTDGALWYLVLCADMRVMCVAYQDNGMKVGDRVTVKGGYRRLDANHVVLDPCLANADPE